MAVKTEQSTTLKPGQRKEDVHNAAKKSECRKQMFDTKWEELVIRKDKLTGKLVGLFACCAGVSV